MPGGKYNPRFPDLLGNEWLITRGQTTRVWSGSKQRIVRRPSTVTETIGALRMHAVVDPNLVADTRTLIDVVEEGNEVIPPFRSRGLIPNGDKAIGTWTTESGGTTNLFQSINEAVNRWPGPAENTHIQNNTTAGGPGEDPVYRCTVDTSPFASGGPFPDARIGWIEVPAILGANTGFRKLAVNLDIGGTVFQPAGGGVRQVHGFGAMYTFWFGEINPATELPWTIADILDFDVGGGSSLRVRTQLGSASPAKFPKVNAIRLRVHFVDQENRAAVGVWRRPEELDDRLQVVETDDLLSLPDGTPDWQKETAKNYLFLWRQSVSPSLYGPVNADDVRWNGAFQDLGPGGEPPGIVYPLESTGVPPPPSGAPASDLVTVDTFGRPVFDTDGFVGNSRADYGLAMIVESLNQFADGAGNADADVTGTSHIAPEVDPVGTDDLLICAWQSRSSGQTPLYTAPGSMTERAETEGISSNLMSATETLLDGDPTGTRTATFGVSDESYSAISFSLAGATGTPTFLSVTSATDEGITVEVTTPSVDAGDALVAVQGRAQGGNDMDPPEGAGWALLADSGVAGTPPNESSWTRAWIRSVETTGAQTVRFEGDTGSKHLHVYALSGIDASEIVQTPSVDSQPYRFNGSNDFPLSEGDKVGFGLRAGAQAQTVGQRVTMPSTQSYIGVRLPAIPPGGPGTATLTVTIHRVSDDAQIGGSFSIGAIAAKALPAGAQNAWTRGFGLDLERMRYIEGFLSSGATLESGTQYEIRLSADGGTRDWVAFAPSASIAPEASFGGTTDSLVLNGGGSPVVDTDRDLSVVLIKQPEAPGLTAAIVNVAVPGGPTVCSVDTVQHIEVSGAPPGSPLGAAFSHYELERQLDAGAWVRAANIRGDENLTGFVFVDRLVPREIKAIHRMRSVALDGRVSAWTTTGGLIPVATGAELIFTSNHRPDLEVVLDYDPQSSYPILSNERKEVVPLQGTDLQVVFKEKETRGVGWATSVTVQAAPDCPPPARGGVVLFGPLLALVESDDVPFVAALDRHGTRILGDVTVSDAVQEQPFDRYETTVNVIPTNTIDVPVEIEAGVVVTVNWAQAGAWDQFDEEPVNTIDNTIALTIENGDGVVTGVGDQVAVISGSRTSNVVTLNVDSHPFIVGQDVSVDVADNSYDGLHEITAVTATTIQYAQVAADDPSSGTGTVGVKGNDRRLMLYDAAFQATDVEVRALVDAQAGTPGTGQSGLVMRVDPNDGGPGAAPIAWWNILFGATGNLLPGVWQYDGVTLLDTNQQSPSNNLYGADVVSASGDGSAVTVVTAIPHLLAPGHIVHFDSSFGTFGQFTVASVVNATTFTVTDPTVGAWNGGWYRWVIAPGRRHIMARLVGDQLTTKYWLDGHPEPSETDALRTKTATLPATLADPAVPLPPGPGRVGIVTAHLGAGGKIIVNDFRAERL